MIYKTLQDILFEYKQKQLAYEERLAYFKRTNKKLQTITEEKKRAGLNLIASSLKGSTVDESAVLELEEKEQEILQNLNFNYDCDVCKDTGYAEGKYCSCLLNKVYTDVLGATDITKIKDCYEKSDAELFNDTEKVFADCTQREIYLKQESLSKRYLAKFPKVPNILLLKGEAGLGKSFLLNCMAKEGLKQGLDVMLISAPSLFNLFFKHRMGEEIPLFFVENATLLLIDDLGTEPPTQNVTVEYLFSLLLKREAKHTVIATNILNLKQSYDERISSRLESKGNLKLLFKGKDVRLL